MWLWNAKKRKKKKLQTLGNKTPDRNHPARFMPWEKASEQRRKFCCEAHWVKKGERPINRLEHREEEQWAARRGAPTAAEPHIPTHTHIHTNSLFSPAHTPAGTSERGPAKQMLCHWLHKEHKWQVEERKKGKGGQTSLLSPAVLNRRLEQPSNKFLCLCSFQFRLSARFIVDVQVLFRSQGQTSFRLTKSVLSFAPALPGGNPDAECGSKRSAEESLTAAR